ncbi:peptidoglycan bridge formation glycyltransferase FemA/FemB family protein [Planococcus sp. X10-3]|uniref:peptidoglycan bridge formation glycyltransferase FemA/FemB family protein n=1 Tax=Planococcus sp. X10-3 TaxID=3061240 RepID=UPI003BB01636
MKVGMELIDLYLDKRYGELYENIENGICEIFEYKNSLGTVRHMFIQRNIPESINGQVYYDIVTPYGYGGPVISECSLENRKQLVREFGKAFAQYCREEKIVSEFIRFHPLLDNAEDFKEVYDVRYMRPTVGTNLLAFEDPVAVEFSKTTRKNIRRAIKEGVTYRVIENPKNLDAFKDIYFTTMKRKNADEYYFFDNEYFEGLLENFGDRLLLTEAQYEGYTIGMTLTFKYKKRLHTHLSGGDEKFHHFYPAYIMHYATVRWGKENGYHLLHSGGGLSNSLDDSLYLFKKQFGKHTKFSFHIGRKVWDREIYSALCDATNADYESNFFPAYRNKALKTVGSV